MFFDILYAKHIFFASGRNILLFLELIILERNDIKVLTVVGQKELKNPVVGGRNIRLDILAKDGQGEYFNVEVQRKNTGIYG